MVRITCFNTVFLSPFHLSVLTKIRLINELNEKELRMGIVCKPASWHTQYKESAWIYVGNMPYELTEGDAICVFSQ